MFKRIVIVILISLILLGAAAVEVAPVFLDPGQSVSVICTDHQTPVVTYLRVGGARVTCLEK